MYACMSKPIGFTLHLFSPQVLITNNDRLANVTEFYGTVTPDGKMLREISRADFNDDFGVPQNKLVLPLSCSLEDALHTTLHPSFILPPRVSRDGVPEENYDTKARLYR